MIYELLTYRQDNAKTGKELAALLGTNIRNVTQQIETERREGKPIIASMNGGYYIASTQEELTNYCDRVSHRARELFYTRQRLLSVIEQLPARMEQQNGKADAEQ